MFLQIILLIVGFVVLIKGADVFVDGASSMALNFKLSKMLIGLTIVAFGTSAPELAVSIQSLTTGSTDMLLGNVVGSNILNILLILGVSSLIFPLKINNATIRKEIPILLLISTLLVVVFLDNLFDNKAMNVITRGDGIVLVLFFMVFIYYLIATMRKKVDESGKDLPKYGIFLSIIFIIIGIVAIIIGSNLVVNSAIFIAEKVGISERIISLTIIALGTSLPELVTSIVAAIKKESDIVVGNIIGSNIFNIGIVLGLPIAIFGNVMPNDFASIDLIMLLVSAFMLFIFALTRRKITKAEGIVMLVAFIIYNAYIILGSVIM